MCDTMVVLGNSTMDGKTLFAKNSDREPNEAQEILILPAADHLDGEMLKCTYISIPQVAHTNAVILSKPFWIWGAEMGANEHGVVIGNEAVFGKAPYGKDPGMIGMDYLRLALERAKTAEEALRVIIDLLELYGQSGNCGFQHELYYHNSFIIADRSCAWVLETIDKVWVAEKVEDIRAISNALSIEEKWDLASENLMDFALENGWYDGKEQFNFKKVYASAIYPRLVTGVISSDDRRCQSESLLRDKQGEIKVEDMFNVLQGHHPVASEETEWRPDYGIIGNSVCMHAGFGPARGSQSVGSMVSHLTDENPVHWLTGTSAPCTSVFKPLWMESVLPEYAKNSKGEYSEDNLFWVHELLHREILRNYQANMPIVQKELKKLQAKFLDDVKKIGSSDQLGSEEISRTCFDESYDLDKQLLKKIKNAGNADRQKVLYRQAWKKFNEEAKFPVN